MVAGALESVGVGIIAALVGLGVGLLVGFVTKKAIKPILGIVAVASLAVAASYLQVGPGANIRFDLSKGGTIPTIVAELVSKLPGLEATVKNLVDIQPVLSATFAGALIFGYAFGLLRAATPTRLQIPSPSSCRSLTNMKGASSQTSKGTLTETENYRRITNQSTSSQILETVRSAGSPASSSQSSIVAGPLLPEKSPLQTSAVTRDPQVDKAEYLLRKMVTLHGAELQTPKHAYEFLRWEDLAVTLLWTITRKSESEMLKLVGHMSDLGLLTIPDLANIVRSPSGPNMEDTRAQRITELFKEKGLDAETARQALVAICEAALGLQDHFKGKIQRYLRSYGLTMIKEMKNSFRFTTLNEADSAMAFIDWLQNDLIMPLGLPDDNVNLLCKQNGLEFKDLIHAADRIDLNVALLDDLAKLYLTGQTSSSSHTESHNF